MSGHPTPHGITVLMPLKHHHPEYVRRALRSLVGQSCSDWHLLIIVEKSDERALRALVDEEILDPRVTVIRNEGRKLAGAMNTGMRRARTPFVGILFADDLWAPNAVQVLSEHIAKFPEVDFFHSARVFIDEDDRLISSVRPSRPDFQLADFVEGSPVKHLLCWRRDKGLEVGGMDETLNSVGPDDYDFPWTMAEAGARFRAIPEPLYRYRDHRECMRLTTHLPLSVHRREIRRIMAKHGVPESTIQKRLARDTTTYLRQCLYKTSFDRWLKELFGYGSKCAWRDQYP
jgi:glycosyltransferase involved in cell wall biosynthesis